MDTDELLRKIRNKFDVESNNQLAKYLGLTTSAISQYSDKVTTENVARLVSSAYENGFELGLEFGIFPLVEFFPINHSESQQNKKWEILPPIADSTTGEKELKDKLLGNQGIYFFYNSECKVIYIGKTEDQTLWAEMKQSFNRKIGTYKYNYVHHPENERELSSPLSENRKIVNHQAYLYDTAYYFSAYKVEPSLIKNLEAFLVRTLPNDLRNTKKENFSYPNLNWYGEP